METKNISTSSFTYSFNSIKTPSEIFELLLYVKKWWIGFHKEIINGKSERIGDEFSFSAEEGIHYSKQRLIELEPGKKIVWLVTESNLSFLSDPYEWNNTKISFEITQGENESKITFSHEGLTPQVECYNACSSAWTQYLQNLEKKLN